MNRGAQHCRSAGDRLGFSETPEKRRISVPRDTQGITGRFCACGAVKEGSNPWQERLEGFGHRRKIRSAPEKQRKHQELHPAKNCGTEQHWEKGWSTKLSPEVLSSLTCSVWGCDFKSAEMHHTGALKLYFEVPLEIVNEHHWVHTTSYFVFHFI